MRTDTSEILFWVAAGLFCIGIAIVLSIKEILMVNRQEKELNDFLRRLDDG